MNLVNRSVPKTQVAGGRDTAVQLSSVVEYYVIRARSPWNALALAVCAMGVASVENAQEVSYEENQ
jgi:hypothetical protein